MNWVYKPIGPIIATFVIVFGWLFFILIFALLWSRGLSTFQDVIVTLVTLVMMGLIIGLIWIVWGLGHAKRWTRPEAPSAKTF